MSYLVLARKWRPRRFDELVGQEHVVRALVNALDSDRVHHAFLFTGTRGVGKTTIARILAKSLNCERGIGSQPCGECATCREIDEGRFVDLIEVDAASRTKVDDTRELLENVQYSPTRGRYKVYLIDEVHMLSGHSFNALLKTLEEPPPHVKFLLATTDPQKLPVTVLSRCLQFNLKRLPVPLIAGRLQHVLQAESVAAEPGAIALLSRAADGSLRDALSLLDQLLAFGGGRVTESGARTMLGTVDRACVQRLVERLAEADAPGLMAAVAEADTFAPDYAQLLDELASLLQQLALHQVVPDYQAEDGPDAGWLAAQSAVLSAEDLQLYYQIAILGRRDLPHAPQPRAGVEMTLLRMLAFRPAVPGAEKQVQPPATPRREPAPAKRTVPVASAAAPVAPAPEKLKAGAALLGTDWGSLVEQAGLSGAARLLAMNCQMLERNGNRFRLLLDQHSEATRTPAQEERLTEALSRLIGEPAKIEFEVAAVVGDSPARREVEGKAKRQEAALESLERDPVVRALGDRLGGVIQPDSVKPLG